MPQLGGGLQTLRRRPEFLRIRNGLRWACAAFVLEAKSRDGWKPPSPVPDGIARFGLTVTKALGSAVTRNRVRRRLKSALQQSAPAHAKPGFDYVVIARSPAETKVFESLVADFVTAFAAVHRPGAQANRPRNKPAARKSAPP
jgi:ribonuclease P protein component